MENKISIYLAVSLIIVSAIIGVGIGYYFNPEYSLAMYDKNSMNLGRADRWLDLRYIDAMISHHQGAILLAKQAEKSQRQEVKELALTIQQDEPKAIAELYQWKKEWYGDVRQVKNPVVANLGEYDDKFDLRFLNALISHHDTGILMVKEVRQKSSRAEILNNADAVESFLSGGVTMLKDWRNQWYNI